MPLVRPFRPLMPSRDKAHLASSRPVDDYSSEELKAEWIFNPFSFLHIIKPGESYPEKAPVQTPEFLRLVRDSFRKKKSEGLYEKIPDKGMFIYRQTRDGKEYNGVIALCHTKDYDEGRIKVHEQTLTEREEKLMHYVQVVGLNAEPVLLFHDADDELRNLIREIQQERAHFDFTSNDKVHHQLWDIFELNYLSRMRGRYESMPHFYIADGHHRCASSALLAKYNRMRFPGRELDSDWFLSAIFDERELGIYDFNRLIKDLNGLSELQFLEKLSAVVSISEPMEAAYIPCKNHEMGMYLGGLWYRLTFKDHLLCDHQLPEGLDAALLTGHILEPILGIGDLKTDKRVQFVHGMIPVEKGLELPVNEGRKKVAFRLFPVAFDQLRQVADLGKTMPPKSTYILPKLRNGLVLFELEQP